MTTTSPKLLPPNDPAVSRFEWAWFRIRRESRRHAELAISAMYAVVRLLTHHFFGARRSGIWIVLYYHAIKDADRERFAAQLAFIARHSRIVPASYDVSLRPGERLVSITFDDAFVSVSRNALPAVIREMGHMTIFVPTKYLGKGPEWVDNKFYEDADETIMTAKELRSLPPEVVTLGSHSVTHPRFESLTAEQRKSELAESKNDLEHILGRPVKLFSYPYGEGTPGDVELARSVGYDRVFTNVPIAATENPTPGEYGRFAGRPKDTRLELILKLNGHYGWLSPAMRVKRTLRTVMRKRVITAPGTFFQDGPAKPKS